MVIVSQDKKTTINFDNVFSIWIGNLLENNNGMYSVEVAEEINETMGYYKTKERAIEVKRQIEEAYINCELIKIPRMDFEGIVTSAEIAKNLRFEMPEK